MGNRMLLSDFIKNENVKLFKDGNFDCLGLATENFLGKKILSFCASEKYLSNVLSNDAVVCLALTEELYKNLKDKI